MPSANPQVVLTEMRDGTAVLLHLDTKFYFTLNATGVLVWKLLSVGVETTRETIAQRMTREFDVDHATALADLDALVSALSAEKLVVPRAR